MQDSGYVFVAEDGVPLHPDFLTRRFHHLVGESELPPVRLLSRPEARFPVLSPVRFPGPLAEHAVRLATQRALHGGCR